MKLQEMWALVVPLICAGLSGCHHKDLVYGTAETKTINVVFDWSDSPDAHPASMVLYLYAADGGDPLRYEFSGRDGGVIRVPFGTYDALCMNSDNTDWLHLSSTRTRYTFGVSVGELTDVSSQDESEYAALYHQCGLKLDGNKVVENPHGLWTGSADSFTVIASPVDQTLTLVPEDALFYYTVDVLDVDGLEDIDGGVPAMLSGMSDGVDALTRTSSTNHISYPFILQQVTRAGNALHAEFTTFGEDFPAHPVHQLTAMLELPDGTWKMQSTDVTDQVHQASDPHHVNIVVKGMKVPHSGGGGLTADVDEWESEHITLKM